MESDHVGIRDDDVVIDVGPLKQIKELTEDQENTDHERETAKDAKK